MCDGDHVLSSRYLANALRSPYIPSVEPAGWQARDTENILIRAGVLQELSSKFLETLTHGDVFRHVLAGAGGVGGVIRSTAIRNALLPTCAMASSLLPMPGANMASSPIHTRHPGPAGDRTAAVSDASGP
jgi:hypothetical protein